MLTLNPALDLISKRKGSTFLGANGDPKSDNIMLTFNSVVALVQISDSKIIKSWALTRGRKNTVAAVFSPEDNEFIVVQNGNVIKTFKENDFETSQQFTLNHKIHSLVPCHEQNPLVMLDDGSLYHLNHVLECPKDIVPDSAINFKTDEIIFTKSFDKNSKELFVCSVCSTAKGNIILLSSIDKVENQVCHLVQPLIFGDRKLKTATGYQSMEAELVLIWDDGSVTVARIVNVSGDDFQVNVTPVAKIQIGDRVSAVSLSDELVAILCKGPTLRIVDLKFGTVHSETSLTEDKINLHTIRDYIILDKPGKLQTLQYVCSSVTLASAVLKHRGDKQLPENIATVSWTSNSIEKCLLSKKDSELVEVLLKTNQSTNFDKTWTTFWKGKTQDFSEHFCTSNMMRDILDRFRVAEGRKDFWPHSALSGIINSGLINGRWCRGIMDNALERSDWSLLGDCLQHLQEIPEDIIAKCIVHIGHLTEHFPVGNGNLENGSNSNDVSTHLQPCLNSLIQLPYSEEILKRELLSFPFPIVLKLLKYLTMQLYELPLDSTVPSLFQVVSWLCLLLDTHLSEVIMMEDSWPLVFEMQEAVKAQELGIVNMLLSQIESNLIQKRKTNDFMYRVEIMQF